MSFPALRQKNKLEHNCLIRDGEVIFVRPRRTRGRPTKIGQTPFSVVSSRKLQYVIYTVRA